jgi:hypothetical protein
MMDWVAKRQNSEAIPGMEGRSVLAVRLINRYRPKCRQEEDGKRDEDPCMREIVRYRLELDIEKFGRDARSRGP